MKPFGITECFCDVKRIVLKDYYCFDSVATAVWFALSCSWRHIPATFSPTAPWVGAANQWMRQASQQCRFPALQQLNEKEELSLYRENSSLEDSKRPLREAAKRLPCQVCPLVELYRAEKLIAKNWAWQVGRALIFLDSITSWLLNGTGCFTRNKGWLFAFLLPCVCINAGLFS